MQIRGKLVPLELSTFGHDQQLQVFDTPHMRTVHSHSYVPKEWSGLTLVCLLC
jgi:hypothetical protein